MTRRIATLLGLSLALAACGGGGGDGSGSSSTTADSAASTDASGQSAPASATSAPEPVKRAKVPFPAESGADVVRLAGLRPTGSTSYEVTTEGVAYSLDLVSDDVRASIHQTVADGQTWVGLDLNDGTVSYVCRAATDGEPTCKSGDPDEDGTRIASAVAGILGSRFIEGTFGPLVGRDDVGVGQDEQVGREVSCLAAALDTGDLRLCVTEEGFITEMTAGTTRVLANDVSTEVDAKALEAPATPS